MMSVPNKENTVFTFNLNQSQASEASEASPRMYYDMSATTCILPVLPQTSSPITPITPISPITPSTSLFLHKNDDDEDRFLLSNGYIKMKKICATLQGELYYGIQLYSKQKVAIKKTCKENMIYCVEEDIVKEAKILHHLTVCNRSTADYIIQFIDFIESQDAYYLVMEYIETNINLEQFIFKAHKYINNGKLQRKQYNKIIKYIFWQLFAVIQWLHNDMHCCHFDLKLENIMLENAEFVENESDGKIYINPRISMKLCDFGRSELFRQTDFSCIKQFDVPYLLPPQLYTYDYDYDYDARCLDIWCLGIMLYNCCFGHEFEYKLLQLQNNKLKSYLIKKKKINNKFCDLISHLLQIDERLRFNILDVLKHECYKVYYQKYRKRILQKAKEQKLKLIQQKEKLNNLPYYNQKTHKLKRVFI